MATYALKQKSYNGMLFRDLLTLPKVKYEWVVSPNKKQVVECVQTLQIHENAVLYKPELILSSWSYIYPEVLPRGVFNSQYWRTEEILAQINDKRKLRELRDGHLELARICDALANDIPV